MRYKGIENSGICTKTMDKHGKKIIIRIIVYQRRYKGGQICKADPEIADGRFTGRVIFNQEGEKYENKQVCRNTDGKKFGGGICRRIAGKK